MKNLLTLLAFIGSLTAFGQRDTTKKFTVTEVMAEFPGGYNGLVEYLKKNVKYPEEQKKKKIEGRVVVKFMITKEGAIDSVSIMKSEPDIDAFKEEAIRVVKNMPKWTPGTQNGKIVRVYYTLPLGFRL